MPQQRPKKQENIEGRIVVARNIHWNLPTSVHNAIESPFARDRIAVLEVLAHLHRVGNDLVRAEVINHTRRLVHDDSKAVSTAAMKLITALDPEIARREAEEQARREEQSWRAAEEQDQRQVEEQARQEEQFWHEVAEQTRQEEQTRDAEKPRWGPAVSSSPARHSWAEEKDERQVVPSSTRSLPVDDMTAQSDQLARDAWTDQYTQAGAATEKPIPQRDAEKQARRKADRGTAPAWLLSLWAPPDKSPIASDSVGGLFLPGVRTDGARRRQGLITLGVLLALAGVIILVAFLVMNRALSGSTPVPKSAPTAAPTARPDVAIPVAIPAVGISIEVGKTPAFVAVSPNGRHVYIANQDAQLLTVVDTAINQVTATVPIKAGPPQFLALTPDGHTLYVSIFNDQQTIHMIDVIDTASNTVVATIPQPARPFLPAVTPDGKRLFVPNHDTALVSVVATDTNTVIAQIKVAPNPHWVAFSRDGSRAYTANHESNLVSVIDTATLEVVATIPVGTSPHSIAVSPDRPLVASVNYDGNSVSEIDTNTLKVVATIPVGKNPQDISWAPDGRFAYVVNEGSNTVSVIDAMTNQVTANIPTGSGPTSITVLPNGQQAYVSNLDGGTLTVLILTG